MVETMRDQRGVGLAANQVGPLFQKVAVIETPDMGEPLVLINPEVMKAEGERQVEEGCLRFLDTADWSTVRKQLGLRLWVWTGRLTDSTPMICLHRHLNMRLTI
ncbi:MAG: hypothetical protein CM1200mP22_32610 [Dehalococcoidia bacterium]|nr:MAG: hypothetical protein CM1200mP22_32610 [Dehalococcoidia bacterium]